MRQVMTGDDEPVRQRLLWRPTFDECVAVTRRFYDIARGCCNFIWTLLKWCQNSNSILLNFAKSTYIRTYVNGCMCVAMLKKAKKRVRLLLFLLAANVICSACVILCKYVQVCVYVCMYVCIVCMWKFRGH